MDITPEKPKMGILHTIKPPSLLFCFVSKMKLHQQLDYRTALINPRKSIPMKPTPPKPYPRKKHNRETNCSSKGTGKSSLNLAEYI